MKMLPMLYESIFGFVALFILVKVLGKTQISQLTAFDFIAAVVLGELVGNALFHEKAGILEIGYVIFLWGTLIYIINLIKRKFKGSRFLLEGKPSMIIHKGKFVYHEMKKNKVDINEVLHLLRGKNVFSVQQVEYAILASNGDLSVLKKGDYLEPTMKDLKLPIKKAKIAIPLILDGEFVKDNLAEANVTEDWVEKSFKEQNIDSIKDIFYAEWMEGKDPFFLPYSKIKKKDLEKKNN